MKRAYTYIITVFILSIILIIMSFILNSNYRSLNIYKNEKNILQSEAYSESLINIALAKEDFKEDIRDLYYKSGGEKSIAVDKSLFKDTSNERLKLSVEKDEFLLQGALKYNEIESTCLCSGSIVNSIYKKGLDTLNQKVLNDKEVEELKEAFNDEEYLSKIPTTIFLEDGDYLIEKRGKVYIYKLEENENILYKEFRDYNLVYLKQRKGRVFIKNKLNLMGIISVENLFINEDININGILDIRGDVNYLNEGYKAKVNVKGLLLNLYNNSENNIDAKYEYSIIKSLSRYIRNFIKLEVKSIRKREIDLK